GGGQAAGCGEVGPPGGGDGGGILLAAGQTVNFQGSLSAKGSNKPTREGCGYMGGGGSGGSIRIEGYDVTLSTVTARGGSYADTYGHGGDGRVTIYYQNSLSLSSSTPSAYTGLMGQAPTPSPTPTPINLEDDTWGTGEDGDLTVNSGQTFNIHTDLSGPRTCADGISYSVTQLTDSWASLSASPGTGCLNPGDEVLLILLNGSGPNVGKYEFLRIGQVIGSVAYFTSTKTNYYGSSADSDVGVGGAQKVALYRVPNYNNVTVNGTLTGNAFDNNKNGVLVFRVAGTLTGTGTIQMNTQGFPDATGYGKGSDPVYPHNGHGGGAGYATNGGKGSSDSYSGSGGGTYGNPQLTALFLGSGGGPAAGCGEVGPPGGGHGGGILFIAGQTLNFQGNLSVKGGNRPSRDGCGYLGGAGSGGSIRVEGHDVALNTVSLQGGSASDAYGYGGQGRIAVYYENTFSGNFTPGYLQKLNTADTIFNDDFESGDLGQWADAETGDENLSAAATADYWGRYGLQIKTPVPGAGTYDDTHSGWQYNGTWTAYTGSGPYNSTLHYTTTVGDSASFTFLGEQFTITYTAHSNRGLIDVFVDGEKIHTINAYNATLNWQYTWTSPTLAAGAHTVLFEHAGGGTYIDVDAITVIGSYTTPENLYVEDDSPVSEIRYRARFYLDPNSLKLGAGEILDLFAGYNAGTQILRVQMRNSAGYQIRSGLLNDTGTWTDTSWYTIQNTWTVVEIDWQALALDGALSLYLDGALKQSLTRVDNDTRTLTKVRLGAMGLAGGTRGSLYIDDFESRRYSYIGLLPNPGVDEDVSPEEQFSIDGLVAWWSLDETSGTRYDSHGGNHLSDNNTVGYSTGKQGNSANFERSDA
ncbi:MAG: hypothetical protein KJ638_15045, partial [Chloroflexi bacterium]|nr:hypothetical protein [Chloroflexota bacterium]